MYTYSVMRQKLINNIVVLLHLVEVDIAARIGHSTEYFRISLRRERYP